MLDFLFELIAEIFVNLLLEIGIDRSLHFAGSNWWMICIAIAGGGLGWASTAVWGKPMLPWMGVRVATIVVVPVVVATIMSKLAERRRARGGRDGVLNTWADAYCFSLAFSVVRFAATW